MKIRNVFLIIALCVMALNVNSGIVSHYKQSRSHPSHEFSASMDEEQAIEFMSEKLTSSNEVENLLESIVKKSYMPLEVMSESDFVTNDFNNFDNLNVYNGRETFSGDELNIPNSIRFRSISESEKFNYTLEDGEYVPVPTEIIHEYVDENFLKNKSEIESIFLSLPSEEQMIIEEMILEGLIVDEDVENVININSTNEPKLHSVAAINSTLALARLSSGATKAIVAAYKIAVGALKVWWVPFQIKAAIAISSLAVMVGVIIANWPKIRPYFSELVQSFVNGLSKIATQIIKLFNDIKEKAVLLTAVYTMVINGVKTSFYTLDVAKIKEQSGKNGTYGAIVLGKNSPILVTKGPIDSSVQKIFYSIDGTRKLFGGTIFSGTFSVSKLLAEESIRNAHPWAEVGHHIAHSTNTYYRNHYHSYVGGSPLPGHSWY